MGCDCGKPKCDGHCGVSPAVLQINNPSECVLFHRVEVPASMGDSKTNPPKSGAYKNVLLYYEADQTSWLYSSDGIPQKLVNGLTDYEAAINLPQINGVTLLGNKSLDDLGITDAIDDAVAEEKAEREAADEALGDEIDVINEELLSRAVVFNTVADMKASTDLKNGMAARTLGFHTVNDGGGATYRITNTGTANEMDVIAVDTLRANLVLPAIATPEMFGASGGADDTNYLKRCFAVAKNIKLNDDYTITDRIDILSNTTLDGNGHTITNNTAVNCFRANTQSNITVKNLNIIGDNTVSEAQIGLNFISCQNIVVERVYISHTGGDGVSFDASSDCVVKDSRFDDTLISVFAYNSDRIVYENIDVYKPRFQYGIQFKSCQNSSMRNVYVDTPKDIGIFVNKGNEEDSEDTYNIFLENVIVKDQGKDGVISGTLQAGLVLANGENHNVNNVTATGGTGTGIWVSSNNTVISNANVKGNLVGIQNTGSHCTIINSQIVENTTTGINIVSTKDIRVANNYFYNNSGDTNHASLILDTSSHITLTGNIFELDGNTTSYNNILVKTSISYAYIVGNVFKHYGGSASYSDYRGMYDFDTSIWKSNGSARFNNLKGLSAAFTAEWDDGGLVIYNYRTAIPPASYNAFSAGDRFINKSGTGYIGWVYDGTTWHGYGAIV